MFCASHALNVAIGCEPLLKHPMRNAPQITCLNITLHSVQTHMWTVTLLQQPLPELESAWHPGPHYSYLSPQSNAFLPNGFEYIPAVAWCACR